MILTAEIKRNRKAGIQPRFHGNGFFQLYLNKEKTSRLHIWHPDYMPQRDHNAQIHDHRFDMKSKILTGSLRHITYKEHSVDKTDATHDLYMIRGASKYDDNVMEHMYSVDLTVDHEYLFATGSEYEFRSGRFHESYVGDKDRITATVIQRSFEINAPRWARIAVDRSIDIKDVTHAFEPELQPTLDEMWKVIEDTLMLL